MQPHLDVRDPPNADACVHESNVRRAAKQPWVYFWIAPNAAVAEWQTR